MDSDKNQDLLNISDIDFNKIEVGGRKEILDYLEFLLKNMNYNKNLCPIKKTKKFKTIRLPYQIAVLACSGLLETIDMSSNLPCGGEQLLLVYAEDNTPEWEKAFKNDHKLYGNYYNSFMFGNLNSPIYSDAYIGLIKLGKKVRKKTQEWVIIGAEIFEEPLNNQPDEIASIKVKKQDLRKISLEGRIVKIPLSDEAMKDLEKDEEIFFYWQNYFQVLVEYKNHYDYLFYTDSKQKLYSTEYFVDKYFIDHDSEEYYDYEEKEYFVSLAELVETKAKVINFDFKKYLIRPSYNYENVIQIKEWILDWNCTTFRKGYFIINPPNNKIVVFKPEQIIIPGVNESFNNLKEYFKQKLPKIHCSVQNLKLTIIEDKKYKDAKEKILKIAEQKDFYQSLIDENKKFKSFLKENNLISHLYLKKLIPITLDSINEVLIKHNTENIELDTAIIISWLCHKKEDIKNIIDRCLLFFNENKESAEIIVKYINLFNKDIPEYKFNISDFLYKQACENGIFNLPWKYVTFFNGYIWLKHPNNPDRVFRHNIEESKTSLNLLYEYIYKNVPMLVVEAKDNKIIKLLSKELLENIVNEMKPEIMAPNFDLIEIKRKVAQVNSLPNNEIKNEIKKKDSKFLNYLCQNQKNKYKLYYGLERRINSNLQESFEESFLFTIAENNNKVISIYENALDSRSTIVFVIDKSKYQQAIENINAFFSSQKVNKRQQIANNRMSLVKGGILSVHRIIHDYYFSWKESIENLVYFRLKK